MDDGRKAFWRNLAVRVDDGTALRVLLVMLTECDPTRRWTGTREHLAESLGVDARTVSRSLSRLESAGEITRLSHHDRNGSAFRLNATHRTSLSHDAESDSPITTGNVREDRFGAQSLPRVDKSVHVASSVQDRGGAALRKRAGAPPRRAKNKTLSPSVSFTPSGNSTTTTSMAGGGGVDRESGGEGHGNGAIPCNTLVESLVSVGVRRATAQRVAERVHHELVEAVFAEWRDEQRAPRPPTVRVLAWRLLQLLDDSSETSIHARDLAKKRAAKFERASRTRSDPTQQRAHHIQNDDDRRAIIAALAPDELTDLVKFTNDERRDKAAALKRERDFKPFAVNDWQTSNTALLQLSLHIEPWRAARAAATTGTPLQESPHAS